MNRKLLTKLAFDGIKKNKKSVFSYVLVTSVTVMIFYIMVSIAWSDLLIRDGKELFYGAKNISLLLQLGSFIVAGIAVIFLLYGNHFVMRSRKKEMGLYGVLGLSKKNISLVLLTDTLVQAVLTLLIGLASGTFLNKLMLLLLYKAVKQPPVNGPVFSGRAVCATLILYGAAFLVCYLVKFFSVRLGNPITLLRAENMGESEPKVKLSSLISGVVCMGLGYYLALTTGNSYSALTMIFVSIILVIAGTYELFIAGSIFILKRLKKNRKFYLRSRNFFSVSNLIFRMKHNASGLASICVLSTGVILLLVCSLSLMMLGEQNLNMRYPTDLLLHMTKTAEEDSAGYSGKLAGITAGSDAAVKESIFRQYYMTMVLKEDGEFKAVDPHYPDWARMETVYLLTLEDYNSYLGKNETLAKDEILYYASESRKKAGESLKLFGRELKVKEAVGDEGLYYIYDSTMGLFEKDILVVSDADVLKEIRSLEAAEGEELETLKVFIGIEFAQEPEESSVQTLVQKLREAFGDEADIRYKEEERQFFYSLYGGVFFVGIFLAVLFLAVTVVIIYYKQMSEGYEDRKRFTILSNAGMTDKEVKQTIKRQVMILFFLPVCTAIIHMAVASRIVREFLQMLVIVDRLTFALSIVIVCFAFFLVYALVYLLTSRQYYDIVYMKE